MSNEDNNQHEKLVVEGDVIDGTAVVSSEPNTVAEDDIPTVETVVTKSPAKKGNGIAWFALLVALLAAGAAGYSAWLLLQQTEQLQALENVSSGQQQQAQSLKQALDSGDSKTTKALAQRDQQLAQLSSALQDANAVIDGHSRRLLSLTATTTDDWRLAEVEYLLRLANQRILTARDAGTALNLLRASDQILLELGDPRLFTVRQAIADDRAALSLSGTQDFDGIFLQLSALGKQIDKLPLLVVPEFTRVEPVDLATSMDAAVGWQQKLGAIATSTWSELTGLLVIQQREADIKPLLPPEQQYYLRSNLRLLINQAQLALLDGRQTAYSESLSSAGQWLRDYFPTDEAAIQAVIADVEQLQKNKVEAELPDVANSLLAIKAFIADQHRLSKGDVMSAVAPAEKTSEPVKQTAADAGAAL